ncbi:hypothetical protein UlMin_043156 [Ulmus minor]
MAKTRKPVEEEVEAPIYGDVLESVLSTVPLIDLVPASQVSRNWRLAISSSLRHLSKIKPWLIVQTQGTRPPYKITTHAYDPRSSDWMVIRQPPIKYISALRSSHSSLLYMLSPTKFAFSFDPLRLTWHSAPPPLVWRTDPIVALVGDSVIVAGGTCDYEDDPLAVEMYDLGTRTWDTCESMPAILKDSAASTSLSIAVHGGEIFVTEKCSGLTYSFDPKSKSWHGPYDLRPDPSVFCSAIAAVDGGLIVVGLAGNSESFKTVKMWKTSGKEMEHHVEIGEMPKEMVEKFVGESSCVSSVAVAAKGNFVFLHNPSDPGVVIQCEIAERGCRWGSVRNSAVNDNTRIAQRLVVECSKVGMADLHRAITVGNFNFAVKHLE